MTVEDLQETRPMFRRMAAAFVVLLIPLAAAAAPQERRDFQVLKDVANQVVTYSRFTVFDDVNIAVDQGIVTLTGKVTMPFKQKDIERRVAQVDGVKSVQNRITVLPLSRFDDDLRFQIARAIYGNPSFWSYAAMANPPIHIIVDNGRVTLTGVVSNELERTLARSIACSSPAFSVKSELKTDAEMRAVMEKIH
jgi:hyperosmotically inducible protein